MTDPCPNCGSLGYDGVRCIHCWWQQGEEHFRPEWEWPPGHKYDEWWTCVQAGWKIGLGLKGA